MYVTFDMTSASGMSPRGSKKRQAFCRVPLSMASPKDKIPGGLGDKKSPKDFDPKQLAKGKKIEMEHTDDPQLAEEISRDHLTEDSAYYTKLEKIEKHAAKRVLRRYLDLRATADLQP